MCIYKVCVQERLINVQGAKKHSITARAAVPCLGGMPCTVSTSLSSCGARYIRWRPSPSPTVCAIIYKMRAMTIFRPPWRAKHTRCMLQKACSMFKARGALDCTARAAVQWLGVRPCMVSKSLSTLTARYIRCRQSFSPTVCAIIYKMRPMTISKTPKREKHTTCVFTKD